MATMHKKIQWRTVNQLKAEANAKWHVLISEIIPDFCYGSQLRIEMQKYGGSLGPFNSAYVYFNFALILPISILQFCLNQFCSLLYSNSLYFDSVYGCAHALVSMVTHAQYRQTVS